MVDIYVLECSDGKYYVGKTKNSLKRITNHFKGGATAWTCLHPPVKVVEIISNCDAFDEDKYTKIYMAKYGIDNVRGGSYVKPLIDKKTRDFILHEFITAQDRCYKCGHSGHFIRNCDLITVNEKTWWNWIGNLFQMYFSGHITSKQIV